MPQPICNLLETAVGLIDLALQGVVVCPTSNIDVSQTVTLAVKHNVPLAVCGGGHSTGGEASIDGGLLIHLRDLNAVTVSPRDKTITCGGGCRWRDVDQAGAKHGLATLGGTVNDTGIGGLTLGGGYGWLTGQLGIVVDNLLAVEMVLADGRIVTCSATSEPDLFWAVRGAGHAFGVATQFVYRAVEKTEPVFGGMVVFPPLPQNIEHLINFANETHAKGDPRTAMMCGFTSMPRDPTNPRGEFGRAVFAACFYDGPADRAEKIFEPLVKDGPMPPVVNSLHAMPYEKLNGMLEAAAIPGGRRTSKGTVYQPPLPVSVFQRVLGQFEEMAQEIPEVGRGGVCLFEFYHTKTVQRVGFEETAFPHRGSHQNIGFVPQWVDPKHDERMRQFARDAMKAVAEAPEKEGLPAAEYMNYDSELLPPP